MSAILDLYYKSQKHTVVQARQIPNLAVNFIDQTNQFQKEFTTNRTVNGPTDFTDRAMQYYNEERKSVVIPDGFQPTDDGILLNRYSPDTKYYNPGRSR